MPAEVLLPDTSTCAGCSWTDRGRLLTSAASTRRFLRHWESRRPGLGFPTGMTVVGEGFTVFDREQELRGCNNVSSFGTTGGVVHYLLPMDGGTCRSAALLAARRPLDNRRQYRRN